MTGSDYGERHRHEMKPRNGVCGSLAHLSLFPHLVHAVVDLVSLQPIRQVLALSLQQLFVPGRETRVRRGVISRHALIWIVDDAETRSKLCLFSFGTLPLDHCFRSLVQQTFPSPVHRLSQFFVCFRIDVEDDVRWHLTFDHHVGLSSIFPLEPEFGIARLEVPGRVEVGFVGGVLL